MFIVSLMSKLQFIVTSIIANNIITITTTLAIIILLYSSIHNVGPEGKGLLLMQKEKEIASSLIREIQSHNFKMACLTEVFVYLNNYGGKSC